MMLFLIIMGSIIGYSSMIGFTYRWFDSHTQMIEDGCGLMGLVWPIALPAGLAWWLGGSNIKFTRVSRVEKRRQKEIAEAQHRKQLAQIAAEELAINERSLNIK